MSTCLELIEGTTAAAGIRGRLADVNDDAYSNNLLLEFLNEGITEFASTTGVCQHTKEVAPDGTNSYINLSTGNLDYRFVSIYAVQYNNIALDFAPAYEVRHWNAVSGTPTAWNVWADATNERMYFDAIPAITANVKLWFTYIPDDMTATSDTVGVPEKYHPALKAYTEFRVRASDRESGLADRAYAEYEKLRLAAAKINESLLSTGGYSR